MTADSNDVPSADGPSVPPPNPVGVLGVILLVLAVVGVAWYFGRGEPGQSLGKAAPTSRPVSGTPASAPQTSSTAKAVTNPNLKGGVSAPSDRASNGQPSASRTNPGSSSPATGTSSAAAPMNSKTNPVNKSPSPNKGSAPTSSPLSKSTAPQSPPPEKPVSSDKLLIKGVSLRDQQGEVIFRGDIDLKPSLQRIDRGEKLRFSHDGTVFQNREGRLPRKPAGHYREWVVPTPGESGPGPQRIVTGQDGEAYYTRDHYRSFQKIR